MICVDAFFCVHLQLLGPDGRPLFARDGAGGDMHVTDNELYVDWSVPSLFEMTVVNSSGQPTPLVGDEAAVRFNATPEAPRVGVCSSRVMCTCCGAACS